MAVIGAIIAPLHDRAGDRASKARMFEHWDEFASARDRQAQREISTTGRRRNRHARRGGLW